MIFDKLILFTPVIIPIVVSASIVTMVTIVSAVIVTITCYLLTRRHKLSESLTRFSGKTVVCILLYRSG